MVQCTDESCYCSLCHMLTHPGIQNIKISLEELMTHLIIQLMSISSVKREDNTETKSDEDKREAGCGRRSRKMIATVWSCLKYLHTNCSLLLFYCCCIFFFFWSPHTECNVTIHRAELWCANLVALKCENISKPNKLPTIRAQQVEKGALQRTAWNHTRELSKYDLIKTITVVYSTSGQ